MQGMRGKYVSRAEVSVEASVPDGGDKIANV